MLSIHALRLIGTFADPRTIKFSVQLSYVKYASENTCCAAAAVVSVQIPAGNLSESAKLALLD